MGPGSEAVQRTNKFRVTRRGRFGSYAMSLPLEGEGRVGVFRRQRRRAAFVRAPPPPDPLPAGEGENGGTAAGVADPSTTLRVVPLPIAARWRG
jgi:hypothetical protein